MKKLWFTTLDLYSGFYQIPLDEQSREITAFITHEGLYEFNRLPMGLATSPSVFQRALTFILKTYIKLKICLVYIDDIVIFSRTFAEHIRHLAEVFKCLKEKAGLKVKIFVCQVAQPSVKFPGHTISADGVSLNPEKVKSIEDFPSPKNGDEVKVALGMCNDACVPPTV